MPESPQPSLFATYSNALASFRNRFPILLTIAVVFSILMVVPPIVDGLINLADPQAAIDYAARGMIDPISVVAWIAYVLLVITPLNFGLTHVFLSASRGQQPSFSELFTTARRSVGSAVRGWLVGIVLGGAILAVAMLFVRVVLPFQISWFPIGFLGALVFLALALILALYVNVRLAFVPYFVVDSSDGIVDAMTDSWEATAGQTWRIAAIMVIGSQLSALVSWPFSIAGMAALAAGGAIAAIDAPILLSLSIVPSMFILGLPLASLYDQVAGRPSQDEMSLALAEASL